MVPARPPSRSVASRRALVVLAAFVVPAFAACGGDDAGGGAAFCSALAERMPVIETPVSDATGVDALVEVYEELDGRTPLAIEESWSQVTDLMRTAATVAPDDPSSVQDLADAAYATERSARDVATWVAETCGFAMPAMQGVEGPVDPPRTTAPDNGKKRKRNATTTSTIAP